MFAVMFSAIASIGDSVITSPASTIGGVCAAGTQKPRDRPASYWRSSRLAIPAALIMMKSARA